MTLSIAIREPMTNENENESIDRDYLTLEQAIAYVRRLFDENPQLYGYSNIYVYRYNLCVWIAGELHHAAIVRGGKYDEKTIRKADIDTWFNGIVNAARKLYCGQ